MDHYKNMMSALGGAMPKCMVWQRMDDDKEKPNEYFNARDIFQLALQVGADDEEMGEDTFYVVSSEGAIGMAIKYEYLTLWMFIPVFDEVIRERELQRLKITNNSRSERFELNEDNTEFPQKIFFGIIPIIKVRISVFRAIALTPNR